MLANEPHGGVADDRDGGGHCGGFTTARARECEHHSGHLHPHAFAQRAESGLGARLDALIETQEKVSAVF